MTVRDLVHEIWGDKRSEYEIFNGEELIRQIRAGLEGQFGGRHLKTVQEGE